MKQFYFTGIVLLLFWGIYCIYAFITFEEMEILFLLYVGLAGLIFFPFYFLLLFFWKRSKMVINALIVLLVLVISSLITFAYLK